MSAKGMNGRRVVYERRGRGIYLSVAALHNESAGRVLRRVPFFPEPTYGRLGFNRVRTGSDGISIEQPPVTQAELD